MGERVTDVDMGDSQKGTGAENCEEKPAPDYFVGEWQTLRKSRQLVEGR